MVADLVLSFYMYTYTYVYIFYKFKYIAAKKFWVVEIEYEKKDSAKTICD